MRKKLSILSLILIFVLMFSACGKSKEKSTADNSKETLKVLTYANWNPFEYLNKGKIVGFDIDIIKAIAEKEGYNYEIKNVSWNEMFTQLKNNGADLGISGITITDARKQTYDFSDPYFVSRQSIVVKDGSQIKSGTDLTLGKQIAVQSGSTGQDAVEKILGQNNSKIKKVQNGLTYMELMHGDADAVVGDDTSNKEFLFNNPKSGLKVIEDKKAFSPEYFGIMYPKKSKLRTEFNKALGKLYDDGTFTKIYKKWFKVAPDIKELKAQLK
ncbi:MULTISPECIES: basic amino acid ABC transporter substrate-binding protein [Clostridium]|uniref:basic amino acid ABC transporter substrate-binding protein n=1 Tax=Clostridium TaxID=1485 RepID=UPI000825B9F8|nr:MULTISPECIES: basic amino acid ABC transporter substrate-binding protein [Clostridium]PJI09553.1 basic amino acid ABC transporter substrate-binding protein [Clostridium sp. CT7]